ncbi:MAG: helix-turn-helix domain-containing protein [Candidatus Odinarchaeota archaeon]
MSSVTVSRKTPAKTPEENHGNVHSGSGRAAYYQLTSLMKICETPNDFLVASYLLENGAATRGEIVRDTGVKRTTAHDSLVRLQVKEIVKKETVKQGRGRPKVYWSLN